MNLSDQTPSQLIKASAGTGKTHQLSLRILRLLALGTEPKEIVALTFTRSAAAEFVRRAIKLIKDAAEDSAKHLDVCKGANLNPEKYNQKFFKELLVKTILRYDQMLLGTLDSYFAKLVNNFPLEVGLEPGKASTIPEYEEESHRHNVIKRILVTFENDPDLKDQLHQQILEFKNKDSDSSALKDFEEFTEKYLRYYNLCSDESRWGNPEAIWGSKPPAWLSDDFFKKHYAKAANVVVEWAKANFGTKVPADLRDFKEAIEASPSPDYDAALKKLSAFFEDYLERGETSFTFNKKDYTLDEAIAQQIAILQQCLAGQHLKQRLKATKALFKILKLYNEHYQAIMLKEGKLTFSDYVSLLQSKFIPDNRKEEVSAWIDQVHFRLDCQIQHWMLDEFQDTSTSQYAVLSRNVLEILGQPSNGRSVFVVGDLKQSLYEWREGNRRLLTQVEAVFKQKDQAEPGTALTAELTKTWRCAPQVLAMVNAELEKLAPEDLGTNFPQAALVDWNAVFKTQEAMDVNKKGEALWVQVESGEGISGDLTGIALQAAWIAKHLKGTPSLLKRDEANNTWTLNTGLSCAILVSKNDDAQEFAEALRNLGIKATDESKADVTQDNPVSLGLLGMLQYTIHPDNQKARALAEMCPPVLKALMSFAPAQKTQEAWKVAVAHIATTYAAHGARAIIDDLIHRTQLDEAKNLELNAEAFIAHRLSQLRVMSTDYDKLGQRDLQNFVAFLVNATNRDATSPDSVQVITIHHSKGLEYDAVYMPLLEDSKAFGGINHDDLMYEPLGVRAATLEEQFKPAWMLKNVHKSVLPLDATIKAGIDNIRAEAAYGSLCRLYVGMTRAKHRLVLMHEKKIKTGKSKEKEVSANFNFLDLTTERLVGDSTYGSSLVRDISIDEIKADRLWMAEGSTREWAVGRDQEESTKAEAKDNAKISGVDYGAVAARRMTKIKPSKGKKAFKASSRSGQHSGKAFGTVVHSLFEGLKWDIDGFIAQSQSKLSKDDATLQDAFKRVEHCLQQPAIRELLLRHQGGELWTEKHAVLRQGTDQYISAVFDRVQVLPGKSAVIVDYKTNTCSGKELVELYQGQMDLYRESVARLCQLPVAAVETWLIHVQETGSEAIKVEPKAKA